MSQQQQRVELSLSAEAVAHLASIFRHEIQPRTGSCETCQEIEAALSQTTTRKEQG